ncbi:tetratricopeptide repeat-containing sulfotransferase family protein [Aestuariivirga sp.]|uniref:tetratricopeptide repeat-containing sulfotransferase family protein n=1 Tax=Aestuariivirga sp. TaxID=2650926 RepID=UPI0039E5111E
MDESRKQFEQALQAADDSLGRNDVDGALPHISYLLKSHPNVAAGHMLMARVHKSRGETRACLDSANRAHRLAPDHPKISAFLAEAYVDLRLPEFALPLLLKAETLLPQDYHLNMALGRCYMLMEKGQLARTAFESAVAAKVHPWLHAKAILELASCLYDIGDSESANQLLDKLHLEYPDWTEVALLRGNNLSQPVPVWLEPALQKISNDNRQSPSIRARALLRLGRCKELNQQYDEAFELWSSSRTLLGLEKHQSSRIAGRLEQTLALYTANLFQRAKPYGVHDCSPIFVVGMPRSGTTLTAQILGAHRSCVNIGETNRFKLYDLAFRKEYSEPTHQLNMVEEFKGGALLKVANEFRKFFAVFTEENDKIIVDKSPLHFESVGFIKLVFPDARIVHCRRHPADNFLSAFKNDMNRNHDYAYDQIAYVEQYMHQESTMRHWRSCFPGQVFEMRYEDTIADQEGVTRRLLEFCGLSWDAACMTFYEQKNTIRTFSRSQVRQPVYSTSVGAWRRYGNRLGPLFSRLKELNYSYETSCI